MDRNKTLDNQEHIPNAETLKAMEDVEHNRNMSRAYKNVEELFKNLESFDDSDEN